MIFVYKRVSTGGQDYDQQNNIINKYLNSIGNPDTKLIEEKISGSVKYRKRKLNEIFKDAKEGDTIIVSELSRLGRLIDDINSFFGLCREKKIHVITAKDGQDLTQGILGHVMVFAFGLCAEIERTNIQERTKAGLNERYQRWESLKDGDIYVSNSGREYVKGSGESPRTKKTFLTDEQKELIRLRNEENKRTPEREECYELAKEMLKGGESLRNIAKTLNSLGKRTAKGCEWKATSVNRLLKKGY